ncbi:hypothetical protein TVAG_293610 [Trichomonas vaginalis G3]|uniref:TH1 domain-containing protein n=1 Tax=Trichomonas vaginalis (strain ATCC PRA-98 / G3) TaxID=412133 RepID=A2GPB6_TRIV3|nr:Class I myosin TH-1 domain family [Trichomonas vaginalis G3]EAX81000.1 hypothetical protein TVAG_293610 [Trichomonas vaginalis G3]KAI5546634.1 Class I myosin TH-1 domain family [Trichomonas vaginalis G3]|eukprot:XP_001293930.1 hypothetical protein [Trichomonas vaginalis G3]
MDLGKSEAQNLELKLRRKRRRNSSASKGTSTIRFVLSTDKKYMQTLADNHDQDNVEYSERVLLVHTEFKLVPFVLIITKSQIYLFKEQSANLKKKASCHNIDQVCLSHQTDNFMLIRLKNGGDILFLSPNKIQIARILAKRWDRSSVFPLSITDRFRYRIDEKTIYAIVFSRSDFGVETSIYTENGSETPGKKSKSSK